MFSANWPDINQSINHFYYQAAWPIETRARAHIHTHTPSRTHTHTYNAR